MSAARAVETISHDARAANKRVFISGMNDEIRQVLSGLDFDRALPDAAFFDTRVEAVKAARDFIMDNGTGDAGSERLVTSPSPA